MVENKTILIVDDVEENIAILERQLKSQGFTILSATEGPKGIHMLKEQHIDLVLLDINMPVIDGITLLGYIKEDKLLSHVAVLMVTADDNVKTAMQCLKKGACGYITKPYSMEQIKQQIQHCIN